MMCPPASAECDPATAGGGGTTCPPGTPKLAARAVRAPAAVPDAAPSTDGGGGTTDFPSPPNPDSVRCAATGNCGAGTITSDRPMFTSPSRRMDAASVAGGGATTEDSSPRNPRRDPALFASGAGATTSIASDATARTLLCTVGGGATMPCSMVDLERVNDDFRVLILRRRGAAYHPAQR